jgi:hypothetical protein
MYPIHGSQLVIIIIIIIIVRSYKARSSIGPMRPWQARKGKSQKIRNGVGRILCGRGGSSVPA